MPDTVTVEPFLTTDNYGNASFGTAVTFSARAVGTMRNVITPNGEEKVSTVTVYIGAAKVFSPLDRITLPIRFTPQQPPILSLRLLPDENGLHHTVIFV